MTSHDTGSTGTPGTPRATAPPARTFGPQGPTIGELSDAYLQDYTGPAVPDALQPSKSGKRAIGRGLEPIVTPPCWTSETALSLNLIP